MTIAPGPMNRGVEIEGELADDPARSAILEQVELGVAVRMACLDLLTRDRRGSESERAAGLGRPAALQRGPEGPE